MKTWPVVFNLLCTDREPPARFPSPSHSLELEILDQQSTSQSIRAKHQDANGSLKGEVHSE